MRAQRLKHDRTENGYEKREGNVKRSVWAAACLVVAGLLFAGCSFVVTDVGLPSGIDIYNESYSTSYRDSDGFVICDNLTTRITYSFAYDGALESWTSYLRGVTTGEVEGRATFFPESDGVIYNSDFVEVTYTIPPYNAPLSVAPQAIVVRPVVRGYTRLYLQINGYRRGYDFLSRDIPVVDC